MEGPRAPVFLAAHEHSHHGVSGPPVLRLVAVMVAVFTGLSLWPSQGMAPAKPGHAQVGEPIIEVTLDAVQTFYQHGVPHTDQNGQVITAYKPGSSFFPIGMYYPQPCTVDYSLSWPAFQSAPDFDGDGKDDWDGTYQLLINLGTSLQEGDRIQIRNRTVNGTFHVATLLPADTDLFYRVLPNPHGLFVDSSPSAPLAQGTFSVPCPADDNDDPSLVETLARGGFNRAIVLSPLHPQPFINLKDRALEKSPGDPSLENFAFVIDAREGAYPSYLGFPEQLFAPTAEGGQGFSQHPDIYGWQLHDEPLLSSANTTPSCDPVLLEGVLTRLRAKYDDHKDATDQVFFLVEGRPINVPPLCGSFPQWDESVRIGDAGNHDHYLKQTIDPIGSLKTIADSMTRQTQALAEQEPSWFTTQAFSLQNRGFPTAAQMRAAVYTAIVHGGTGVWYFMFDSWVARSVGIVGVRPTIPASYPERPLFSGLVATADVVSQGEALWRAITEVSGELAALEPVMFEPTTTRPYRVFVSQKANSWSPVRTMLKSIGDDHYLIAVNMDEVATDAKFDFGHQVSRADVLGEDRQITGGIVIDHFEPFDVHIYHVQFPDSDADGVDDFTDNCSSIWNPAQTDQDGDSMGLGCDPNDSVADSDRDGCSDAQELGPDLGLGGGRDPQNPWDFFDTPNDASVRDGAINGLDIVQVLRRFGTSDANGTAPINRSSDPLTLPPADGSYHPAFDRSKPTDGTNSWSLGPPDGSVRGFEISILLSQYGQRCRIPSG